MATRKRPRTIYPGDLGRAGLVEELTWKGVLAITNISSPDFETLLTMIQSEHEKRLLAALFRHYRIPTSGTFEARLHALVLCFARDHVPAFGSEPVVRRGRPTKPRNRLADLYKLPNARRAGRQRSLKLANFKRNLLMQVCDICESQGYKGHGARTKALKEFCKSVASEVGKSPMFVERGLGLKRLRKELNSAEKLYPEIAAKLPR